MGEMRKGARAGPNHAITIKLHMFADQRTASCKYGRFWSSDRGWINAVTLNESIKGSTQVVVKFLSIIGLLATGQLLGVQIQSCSQGPHQGPT